MPTAQCFPIRLQWARAGQRIYIIGGLTSAGVFAMLRVFVQLKLNGEGGEYMSRIVHCVAAIFAMVIATLGLPGVIAFGESFPQIRTPKHRLTPYQWTEGIRRKTRTPISVPHPLYRHAPDRLFGNTPSFASKTGSCVWNHSWQNSRKSWRILGDIGSGQLFGQGVSSIQDRCGG